MSRSGYGPLLKEAPASFLEPFGPDWSIAGERPCQVWNHGNRDYEPFTWFGACDEGRATGEGRLTYRGGEGVYVGAMMAGRLHSYTLALAGERPIEEDGSVPLGCPGPGSGATGGCAANNLRELAGGDGTGTRDGFGTMTGTTGECALTCSKLCQTVLLGRR